jgi:hypothetical protein
VQAFDGRGEAGTDGVAKLAWLRGAVVPYQGPQGARLTQFGSPIRSTCATVRAKMSRSLIRSPLSPSVVRPQLHRSKTATGCPLLKATWPLAHP